MPNVIGYILEIATKSIQSYIFSSNRLAENLGASWLVSQATEVWPEEVLENHFPNEIYKQAIETQNPPQVERVYAGGGKCQLIFADTEQMKKFLGAYSRRLLKNAPGLQVEFKYGEFIWDAPGQSLRNVLEAKLEALSVPQSERLGGLSVTAVCQSSGLPAVAKKDGKLISAATKAKTLVNDTAFSDLFDKGFQESFLLSSELDKLGRSKGEFSYIAVVHADGNRMGKLFENFLKEKSDRDYIEKVRNFSDLVKKKTKQAMQEMLKQLAKEIIELNKNSHNPMLHQEQGKYIFPLRPIIIGGDDVTYVCDARYGLRSAWLFLKFFEECFKKVAEEMKEQALTACAGVAIAKVRYPFARIYDLAEDLTKSAKKLSQGKVSCLDWHQAMAGISGDIETIREREYKVQAGSLTRRPFTLEGWQELEGIFKVFSEQAEERRNKLKALRQALRNGPEDTQKFFDLNPELCEDVRKLPSGVEGWVDKKCVYYDALELIDGLYYLIEEKGSDDALPA
jgi:hypothetical protein